MQLHKPCWEPVILTPQPPKNIWLLKRIQPVQADRNPAACLPFYQAFVSSICRKCKAPAFLPVYLISPFCRVSRGELLHAGPLRMAKQKQICSAELICSAQPPPPCLKAQHRVGNEWRECPLYAVFIHNSRLLFSVGCIFTLYCLSKVCLEIITSVSHLLRQCQDTLFLAFLICWTLYGAWTFLADVFNVSLGLNSILLEPRWSSPRDILSQWQHLRPRCPGWSVEPSVVVSWADKSLKFSAWRDPEKWQGSTYKLIAYPIRYGPVSERLSDSYTYRVCFFSKDMKPFAWIVPDEVLIYLTLNAFDNPSWNFLY